MGNESSKLKGLVIEKTAIEANDFWALYNAESPTTSNVDGRLLLSVFQGEPIVKGQLWSFQDPMERAIKNMKIFRHPYILKYVTTWVQSGQKYLATERVRPLVDVLATQSDMQICLGLRTILCSLIFLTEKAMARHLNICTQSIYVTDDGSWRLAGFEFVWKANDINSKLLELAKPHRYQLAMDELEHAQATATIEQYAFATLCQHIFDKYIKDKCSTPHMQEFRAYCSTHLRHKDASLRPRLSAVLLHPYFNHEFVLIHSFLFELPLKSVQERQEFFTSLVDRLRYFDEQVVAAQLAGDLLSRMVLLDPSAQLCVTPYVLRTKTDHATALFSRHVYTEKLLPHILKLFRLRDAQIRLILLEYFIDFVRLLADEQIKSHILPYLIEGMNDTNEVLVAKTLRCMADLIGILGAATVLGSQRSRIFADGRPHAAVSDATGHWVEPRSITPFMNSGATLDEFMVSGTPTPPDPDSSGGFQTPTHHNAVEIPTLRPSPDGGEDNILSTQCPTSNNSGIQEMESKECLAENLLKANGHSGEKLNFINDKEDDEETWTDWEATDDFCDTNSKDVLRTDNSQLLKKITEELPIPKDVSLPTLDSASCSSHATQATQQSFTDSYQTAQSRISTSCGSINTVNTNRTIDDLSVLDIQVQVSKVVDSCEPEFDYFKDMEPVIDARVNNNAALVVQKSTIDEEEPIDISRFAALKPDDQTEAANSSGWNIEDEFGDSW